MEKNDTLEVIQRIPLDKLRPYPDHPFGVRDDDTLKEKAESGERHLLPPPVRLGILRRLRGKDGLYQPRNQAQRQTL